MPDLRILALLLFATPSALAFQTGTTPTPACNGLSRELQIHAGTTQTEQDCAQFSFSLLGLTFTSPPSCPNTRTTRSEDTWSCSGGGPGLHCNPRGLQVTVKQFASNQPCPSPPASIPASIDEANAAVQCQLLPMTNEFIVFSATVKQCPTEPADDGRAPAPPHGETREVGGELILVHHGSLDELAAARWKRPWLEQIEALQTLAPEDLPDALAATLAFHPRVPGLEVEAIVRIDFFGVTGLGTVRNAYDVLGTVTADGSFELRSSRDPLDEDGSRRTVVEDHAFDGRRYVAGTRGAEYAHAYFDSAASSRFALQNEAAFAWPLLRWARDPFLIPRIPGTVHESDLALHEGERHARVVETYPQLAGSGRTVYEIHVDGPPHPTRIETFDAAGQLVRSRSFLDYRPLLPDLWRPMRLVDQRFEGATGTLLRRTTVEIASARVLSAGEVAALPAAGEGAGKWLVRID